MTALASVGAKTSLSRWKVTSVRWICPAFDQAGMIAGDVTLRLDSCLHVPRTIPVAVLAALKRLATFANPVFHHKLGSGSRRTTRPDSFFAGEWHPDRLVLPRGAMSGAVAILESAGAT